MTKPRTVALAAVALAIGVPAAGSVAFAGDNVDNCDILSVCNLEADSVGSVATGNGTGGGLAEAGDAGSDFATETATATGADSHAQAVNAWAPFGQADATAQNGGHAAAINFYCGSFETLRIISEVPTCVAKASAKARGRGSQAVAVTEYGGQATARAIAGGQAVAVGLLGGHARAIAIGQGAGASAYAVGACRATSITIASVQLKHGSCGELLD